MNQETFPNIMIVEDEASVSMELKEMLEENGYRVPGVASSGEEATAMARTLRPDLILMDIKLPGKSDGIEAAAKIRSRLDIPSIFLTGYGERELVKRAVKAEPLGYIMKPLNDVQIRAAIDLALGKIDRKNETPRYTEIPAAFLNFSAQEIKVANMIREGKGRSEIAEAMGLTVETIDWHRKKIRKKLGISHTETDLAAALQSVD